MRRYLSAVAVGLFLTACSYGATEDRIYRPPGVAAAEDADGGEELYLRDCAWCHGRDGTGTARGPEILTGTNGPAFMDFVLSTGRMPLDDPDERMVRGETIYSEEEIDELVAYVESLGTEGPDIPTLALEDVDLSHGMVLYQENCAACHSTTGVGGALTEGTATTDGGPGRRRIVVPPVTKSTPLEVAEAIRVGPGTMPVFNEDVFDDEDLAAIVAYVEYLKNPDDRGGASVGRIGPVVEGAIGWFVGLGVLLVFIRWIGTKRGDE
ncbi:MAG: c-type cytochrome [Actinobacteria bacterium]|nr:c-type cytochrome [Actinomycetota bacterium]